ncbi:tetratricopeptide repeat protein [Thiothrix subterranea]|uniref:tetratricopeptide repeat protein n=1 Tax=Thiothrix subterranea TaxID=2735563 RepID=UPI00192CA29C|nr:tetratricopeptide repeat protein [Thiothrix subterranea]QQZ28858.1 tetratricopeptide repeat protein [Thiothrix subterranea]
MVSSLVLGCHHYHLSEQLLLDTQGASCTLRSQSLSVLHYLALNANKTVSKAELFAYVWKDAYVTDDSLVQCIADIRRVLQDNKHEIVKTVPRKGYLLVAHLPVTDLPASEGLLPFIGRHKELHELTTMLHDASCRLITVVGLGGVGKSRLVKTLAQRLAEYFRHGIGCVELASVQHPDLIANAIGASLGIALQGSRPPIEQLHMALSSQHKLLILDNLEHLLPDVGICEALLEHCPTLKILATSRLPLQVYGEWRYQLQGLLPPSGEIAPECAAFSLFVQSARQVDYTFAPDETDQQTILEICRLVDGLPLGIEMAARWIRQLSCEEILQELRSSLLPTALNANSKENASTMPAVTNVVQQSWQMLTAREQQIMQALALFQGKFTREAASAVAGAGLADYGGLLDKSMLYRKENGHYVIHEVMRQYANEVRFAKQSHCPTTQRFVEYHLEVAERVDAGILGGQQLPGLAHLEGEHDNFRACLALCHSDTNPQAMSSEIGLRLVGSLGMFWFMANHWQEGYRWAESFLAIHRHAQPSLAQAMAMLTAGGISALLDNHGVAEQYLSRGTEMAAHFGGDWQTARGLMALSVFRRLQGRYDESLQCGQQSMQLFATVYDEGGYQFNLANSGHVLLRLGRYDEAVQALEQCIDLNQKIGLTISMPYALVNLGRLHWQLRQLGYAREYLHQSIQIAEKLGIALYRAQALCKLGWIELSDANIALGLQHLNSSMEAYLHLGDREGQIEVMRGIGVASALQGNLAQAWQCIAAADNLSQHLKLSPSPDTLVLLEEVKQRIQQGLTTSELALHRHMGLVSGLESLYTDLVKS